MNSATDQKLRRAARRASASSEARAVDAFCVHDPQSQEPMLASPSWRQFRRTCGLSPMRGWHMLRGWKSCAGSNPEG